MTKKEYISSLENLIVNRIKYHAPQIKEGVDYALLDAIGIDGRFPIFIFDKPIDKIFYKAFVGAKKRADFNLILTQRPKVSSRKLNSLEKTYTFYKDELGSNLFHTLNQLNINYLTHTDFQQDLKNEYLKFNDKEISFDYIPYFYGKKVMDNRVILDAKSFILNGKNYFLTFTNTSNEKKTINFEFNLPLPRGYYLFKKGINFIEIENLTNREKAYFNFNLKNANISFSTVSGIESSTFACVNLECKIDLLPKESRKCFFNFGENKYILFSPKDIANFFQLSQIKMNEIFDLKVTTRDSQFDELFNRSLPQNIWEKWQKFDVDEESENEWVKMKSQIIKNDQSGVQISKDFKGLKEVKFFRNLGWKRVFVVHNNSTYLFADRIKYFNFTLLTKEIFEKNNEIYLSFAE